MTERDDDYPWEGRCADAAYAFGLRCANLVAENPYDLAAPLDGIVNTFMTELWDRNFSRAEIRAALKSAVEGLARYADSERRSSTSAELIIADWRAAPT